ncbi:MAG: hypothetical protein HYS61_00340 [Acidobacteria bacterium]|nr:hypothetical protein [Acidobacteriota bacterium]
MREHPDHFDAELLLRLYDLRREAKLRQARDWFVREFEAANVAELQRLTPPGSKENDFFRMNLGYWNMVASIVNHGLIKEEFFFENTGEFWVVWDKIKHLAPEMRDARKNPLMWKNLEALAEKFEKWMARQAPEALEAFRQRLAEASKKK